MQLNSARSRGLALIAIALTSAVLGATVTGQVFAYKMKTMDHASVAALPVKPEKPEIETTTVLVAARPLRFGDIMDASAVREMKWIAGEEPAGSFRTLADLTAAGEPRQVLTAIEPDEPILTAKVTGPGEQAKLAAVVEEGMRAITVSVDEILGVAGFVYPGDRVDVTLTRNTKAGDPLSSRSDVLLQDVKVLAIDQMADERLEKPSVSRAVTLEVNPEMAQKLVLGQSIGKLSLLLRPAGSAHKAKTLPVLVTDLSGDTPGRSPVINVIRGTRGTPAKGAAAEPSAADTTAPATAQNTTPEPASDAAGAPRE